MKTLLVAPRHEDLTLSDAEVQRLVNALSAKIVIGQVDSTDVVDAIAKVRTGRGDIPRPARRCTWASNAPCSARSVPA